MKEEFSAGVILFHVNPEKKDEVLYLLLHYPRGYWDLVKGKLEEGETAQQTALRELKEETGLEANLLSDFEQILHYYFKSPDGDLVYKTVKYFVGQSNTFEVSLSHEHIGYKWATLSEALKQLTYTNAQHVIRRADHFIQHYIQKNKT